MGEGKGNEYSFSYFKWWALLNKTYPKKKKKIKKFFRVNKESSIIVFYRKIKFPVVQCCSQIWYLFIFVLLRGGGSYFMVWTCGTTTWLSFLKIWDFCGRHFHLSVKMAVPRFLSGRTALCLADVNLSAVWRNSQASLFSFKPNGNSSGGSVGLQDLLKLGLTCQTWDTAINVGIMGCSSIKLSISFNVSVILNLIMDNLNRTSTKPWRRADFHQQRGICL